jgi:hypothetical protein
MYGLSFLRPLVTVIDVAIAVGGPRYGNRLLTARLHSGRFRAAVDGHHGRPILKSAHAHVAIEGAELRRQEECVRRPVERHRSRAYAGGVMIGRQGHVPALQAH